METNTTSSRSSRNERKNSKRTFIFWAIGGMAVAGALTAGFMLGGASGGGGSTDAHAQVSATASAGDSALPGQPVQPADGGPSSANDSTGATGGDGDSPPQPTATPEPESEDGGSNDATVTPDPDDDGCNFCEDDGDLAPQPTSTPSCAFCPEGLDLVAETPVGPDPCLPDCIADVDLGQAVDDTAPKFESITTDFCYPVLQVHIEVDAPAEVWFEYSYDGHDYESVHMDADNEAVIARDMGFHSWDVYFIGFYFVHAIDLSGNHSVSEAQSMPDPNLAC